MNEPEENWPLNYFNYFTEVEEHFQRARGTGLFLLSPVDWALIETWKDSGVPLEAVLRGIDEAFEKWRSRKSKFRQINSLAYCTQAVLEQAQRMAGLDTGSKRNESSPPFESGELGPSSAVAPPSCAQNKMRHSRTSPIRWKLWRRRRKRTSPTWRSWNGS